MQAELRWTGKMGFVGIPQTNHAVLMDASPKVGGDGAAASPMELILMGLAGCSGMDVVSILRKKEVEYREFQIKIEAERAQRHPRVFQHISLTFIFRGENLARKPLEDSVRLSLGKYCSATAMVSKTAEIDWKIEIMD